VTARNARFVFEDILRPGAAQTVQALERAGKSVEILSGDTEAACRDVAETLGVRRYAAALLPSEKWRALSSWRNRDTRRSWSATA
jgi:Cu2+-exporting ATPase